MRHSLIVLLLAGCTTSVTPGTDPAEDPAGSFDTGSETGGETEPDTDDTDDTGSAPEDTGTPDTEPEEEEDPEPVDYRTTGPHGVSAGSQTVQASCSMSTRVFTPDSSTGAPLVLLGHGFARTGDQLVGWAEHLASWGFTVAVPDLCHSSFWDADHEANGEDLLAIPDALGFSEVIYAGHSAGGLAAFVGAALDSRAIGVIGLDATDSDGVGISYAADLTVPALGLLGEPSDCNADCNGFELYDAAAQALPVRVTDADHCDYESDTDWMCTTFCTNSAATFSDSDIQDSIRGLMTAAAFELTEGGTGWWESGAFYDSLLSEGRITPL